MPLPWPSYFHHAIKPPTEKPKMPKIEHTCGNPSADYFATARRRCLACNPLAGVDLLRAAVRWANGQPESEHDGMTAEQIIARFVKVRDE